MPALPRQSILKYFQAMDGFLCKLERSGHSLLRENSFWPQLFGFADCQIQKAICTGAKTKKSGGLSLCVLSLRIFQRQLSQNTVPFSNYRTRCFVGNCWAAVTCARTPGVRPTAARGATGTETPCSTSRGGAFTPSIFI